MTEQMDGQASLFAPDTWSGKMSQEHSAVTKDKISQPSSKKRSGSLNRKPPMCLCLKKDGQPQEWQWETDGALLGGYSMHSFGESPNAAVESHLSQILEGNPHPKYYLSAKACMGILNRAERRGKDLPPELKQALVMQSELGGGCDGGGKGALVQEEVSGTLGCNNDQTIFYAIGSYHSNAWKSDNPHSGVYETDVAKTLDAINCGYPGCNQGGTAILDMTHANDVIRECGETVPTLQSQMGTGGNQVPLVYRCTDVGFFNSEAEKSPTLLARTYKDPHLVSAANKRVRRLTPLECERLQGFPDHWTDIGTWVDSKGKKHETSDAARYKALGNSIALPPWKWVLKRLCAQYERDATMASLFDGIGGFPLLWEQLNGEGSCLWASEIEEFPMAVTKLRFSPTGQKG